MTDAAPPSDAAQGQPQPTEGQPPMPGFRILAQFVRDLSFENPRAPDSLRIQGQPKIDMGVELSANGRPDGLFEVNLKISVGAKHEDQAVFQAELVYGGLFQLNNVSEQDIEPMLLIECPRYLFPFAREVITKASADGGFYPPFMLDPIDFTQIYMSRQAQLRTRDGQPFEPQGQA